MSIAALIQGKSDPDRFATATVATFATQKRESAPTVEKVATVTVARDENKPVVNHGRTFRKCRACGRMGWHPQATADICCGQAMELIEKPTMTVADYVAFIGCPKAYASGAISHKEILDMMRRDMVEVLP